MSEAEKKQLKITSPFKFAHDGYRVVEYAEGDIIEDPSPELVDLALAEKWGEEMEVKAPENKSQAPASTKKTTAPAPKVPSNDKGAK